MKKFIIAAFICSLGVLASCKDKDKTNEDDAATTDIVATDTMATDTVAAPPIDNPQPGVEESGSHEQIP